MANYSKAMLATKRIIQEYKYNTLSIKVHFRYTVYGKTFEWKIFCGWYANDHSQENAHGCLLPSCHVLYETYRITYSIKLHGKIFAIECKIAKSMKVFPLESFAVYDSLYTLQSINSYTNYIIKITQVIKVHNKLDYLKR